MHGYFACTECILNIPENESYLCKCSMRNVEVCDQPTCSMFTETVATSTDNTAATTTAFATASSSNATAFFATMDDTATATADTAATRKRRHGKASFVTEATKHAEIDRDGVQSLADASAGEDQVIETATDAETDAEADIEPDSSTYTESVTAAASAAPAVANALVTAAVANTSTIGGATDKGAFGCWGNILSGKVRCTGSDYGRKTMSFRGRFCETCMSDGVSLPTYRVRALYNPINNRVLTNTRNGGVWNVAHVSGIPPFRVVNNTSGCSGPQLVIFHPSSSVEPIILNRAFRLAGIPDMWLNADRQSIHLHVSTAMNTLVPSANLTLPVRRRRIGADAVE